MNTAKQKEQFAHSLPCRVFLAVVGVTALLSFGAADQAKDSPDTSATSEEADAPAEKTHMSEELRSSVKKVVVLPTPSPANHAVTGSYEDETLGLFGGMEAGAGIGKGVTPEVGGIPVNIPFRILTLPGALFGGISGKTKREIQEFRDALTDELSEAASQPLTNDALASDVFWGLRNVPNLDSKVFALTTPIPEDTDAILYVSLNEVTIDVRGKEAIITTSASATLRRLSDGADLYANTVQYQDQDTLANWTRNENALFRDYANFSRHYLGREITAEVFDRVELKHELVPKETDTVARVKKNDWQGISRSPTPTLAWELTLLGDDSYGSWAGTINEADIAYDVEIYDMHRPVYSAKRVHGHSHTVAEELEGCKKYRWSVRPSYRVGNDVKFGEWMRFNSGMNTKKGKAGTSASEAPAYIHDFASLEIKCGRR
jgi:hypothetical protein